MPVHRHPVAAAKITEPLSHLPLDHALIERLRASFQLIRARGQQFAETFYAKLFAAAPEVRPLFRSQPQSQTAKLLASLDAIVRNLTNPAENAALLTALGKRHAGYGARPEHYDLVIGLLIESMQETLGPGARPEHLAEWRIALRLISDQMIAAAEPLPASPPCDA